MGNFAAPNKLSSEERFMRSASLSNGPSGFNIPGGHASLMVRSCGQGDPGGMGAGVWATNVLAASEVRLATRQITSMQRLLLLSLPPLS